MNRYLVSCTWGLWLAVSLLVGCGGGQEQQTAIPARTAEPLVPTPAFSRDSAYAQVAAQVAFGPRVPNSEGHRRCGDYLLRELRRYGWAVQEQAFVATAFDGTALQSRNIIGTINPTARRRVLLCAHWDTRPFADHDEDESRRDEPILGANDGGSGVAVLLEVARLIGADTAFSADLGLDIIFFDAEDYGPPDHRQSGDRQPDAWCLGSQHWARNPHVPGYSAYYGILLDMVGGRDARFMLEETSMRYAPSVMRRVWDIGQRLGHGGYFRNEPASGIIDDHYYINTIIKIPTIDIIHYDPIYDHYFTHTWHTHDDTLENIDPTTLGVVGQTVLQTLYQEAARLVN